MEKIEDLQKPENSCNFETPDIKNSVKKLVNYSTPYILNGEFFEIISQEGESVTVKCCHCETRNIYKGSVKSTGNFHMHIKRKHPGLLPRVHELKLTSFLSRKATPKRRNLFLVENASKIKRTNHMKESPVTEVHCHLPQAANNNNHTNNNNNNKMEDIKIKQENIELDIDDESIDSNSLCNDIPCIQQIHEEELPTNLTMPPQQDRSDVEHILLRLEDSLRGIEREMRIRNQIETNRLCLELAEFKFLHPNFSFSM